MNNKLSNKGGFREEEESKLKGFAKERSFKPNFQERIRIFKSVDGRYVTDTLGNKNSRREDQTSRTGIHKRHIQGERHKRRYTTGQSQNKGDGGSGKGNIRQSRTDDRYFYDFEVPDNTTKHIMNINTLKDTKVLLTLHKNLFRIEGRNIHKVAATPQSDNIARVKEPRLTANSEDQKHMTIKTRSDK